MGECYTEAQFGVEGVDVDFGDCDCDEYECVGAVVGVADGRESQASEGASVCGGDGRGTYFDDAGREE